MSSSGTSSSLSSSSNPSVAPQLIEVFNSLPNDFKTLFTKAGYPVGYTESLADSGFGSAVVFVPSKIPGVSSFSQADALTALNAHISPDGVKDANGKCIQSVIDSYGNIISVGGQKVTSSVLLQTAKNGTPYTLDFIHNVLSGSTKPNADGTCPVLGSMGSMDM